MVAAYMGTNGTIRGTLILERNAVVTKNATSMTSTTARARRFWARLGAKLESMKSCSSDAVGAVFPAVISGSFMVHLVCSRPRCLACDGIISRRPARGGPWTGWTASGRESGPVAGGKSVHDDASGDRLEARRRDGPRAEEPACEHVQIHCSGMCDAVRTPDLVIEKLTDVSDVNMASDRRTVQQQAPTPG